MAETDMPSSEALTFEDLDLDDRLKAAVAALGFDTPTPIQAETIKPLRAGRDVVGRARTGSGKTAAFGLPLLEAVKDGGQHVRALVMAPTRELAMQVTDALRSFAKQLPVRVLTLYGGAAFEPQLRSLKQGVPVVVGTPGRLRDHFERGTLDLSRVEMVVLDEADEMLRMGFIDDVELLLDGTPDTRQVVLFSATMPPPIARVAKKHLKHPVQIQVESAALTTSHIEQRKVVVPPQHRLEALQRLLASEPREATLIFARTRTGCAELADALCASGVSAEALHGDLNQAARERVLRRLRAKTIDVVVATDVAARGIDVDHITHVVNFDLPDDVEQYVHRIGRTGRAGRDGVAINLVRPADRRRIAGFERDLKTTMDEVEVPSDKAIQDRLLEQMSKALIGTIEEDGLSNAALEHVASLSDDYTPDQVAAAAIQLLAGVRGTDLLSEPSDDPPGWVRFARGRDRDDRPAFDRGPRKPRGEYRDLGETIELFIPVGRQHGVQARDVVGALANEGGIPGAAIGRVNILGNKTFATVSRDEAERFLNDNPTLAMRGQMVEVTPSFNSGGGPRRSGPPRGHPVDDDRPPRARSGPRARHDDDWPPRSGRGRPPHQDTPVSADRPGPGPRPSKPSQKRSGPPTDRGPARGPAGQSKGPAGKRPFKPKPFKPHDGEGPRGGKPGGKRPGKPGKPFGAGKKPGRPAKGGGRGRFGAKPRSR